MDKAHDRGRLDWLVEIMGAAAPAAAAAFAAVNLAPFMGWSLAAAVLVGFGGAFAIAYIVMRIVPAEARRLALPDFEPSVELDQDLFGEVMLVDDYDQALDELLLDQPLVTAGCEAVAELLLDDALPVPEPGSRVVQLFADGRMPTAGQLKQRIDRHLADGAGPAQEVVIDAAATLNEALAKLRRTLRQA